MLWVEVFCGGPGQIRTADLRFRKPSLYPSELQGLLRKSTSLHSKRTLHIFRAPRKLSTSPRLPPSHPYFAISQIQKTRENTFMNNESVINVLEDLIQTNRDSQNGYRDAAEHVKTPELRNFFNQQS